MTFHPSSIIQFRLSSQCFVSFNHGQKYRSKLKLKTCGFTMKQHVWKFIITLRKAHLSQALSKQQNTQNHKLIRLNANRRVTQL